MGRGGLSTGRMSGQAGLLAGFVLLVVVAASFAVPAPSVGCGAGTGKTTILVGSGCAVPFLSKWFGDHPAFAMARKFFLVQLNFQGGPSEEAGRKVASGEVDFAVRDRPISREDAGRLQVPILQVPVALSAVAVVYNVPGVESGLKLSGDTLASIFLGKIAAWNDERIASENPGLVFPDAAIVVIPPGDGSGAAAAFAEYLAVVSPDWKAVVGPKAPAQWPVGKSAEEGKGVASVVRRTPGSVGVVDAPYASRHGLVAASLKNRDGFFVPPTPKGAGSAAGPVPMEFELLSLIDRPGREAYPVVTATWLAFRSDPKERGKGLGLVHFLKWAVRDGQKSVGSFSYAPISKAFVERVDEVVAKIAVPGLPPRNSP